MPRSAVARLAVIAAAHILIVDLGSPEPAYPFAPQAAAAIAERIPIALPPAARWNPSWGEAAAAEVHRRLSEEDRDPEAAAPGHRFASGAQTGAGDAVPEAAAAFGYAPQRLAAAAAALQAAFSEGEDAGIVRAMADVAVSATDLADPFQVSGFDLEEVPSARARFSDLLAPSDLVGIDAASAAAPASTLEGAITLAAQSAAERRVVEEAVGFGNDDVVRALRRRRLEAALGLGHAVTLAAWNAARAPTIEIHETAPGALRIAPNPVRRVATLAFTLPGPGIARLELFDATGRKVGARALGPRPAGAQGAVFGGGMFDGLPPGLYVVAVSTPGFRATGRFVHIR